MRKGPLAPMNSFTTGLMMRPVTCYSAYTEHNRRCIVHTHTSTSSATDQHHRTLWSRSVTSTHLPQIIPATSASVTRSEKEHRWKLTRTTQSLRRQTVPTAWIRRLARSVLGCSPGRSSGLRLHRTPEDKVLKLKDVPDTCPSRSPGTRRSEPSPSPGTPGR